MLPFKLVYSEKYFLPIGEHVFRADKYRLIRERLFEQGFADDADFLAPQPASESDVMLVHSPHYVNKLMEGSLTAREENWQAEGQVRSGRQNDNLSRRRAPCRPARARRRSGAVDS